MNAVTDQGNDAMTSLTCTVGGCERTSTTAGYYCGGHYQRVRTTGAAGSAQIRPRHKTDVEAFAFYTQWEGGHLIWKGALTPKGYGVIKSTLARSAHRYSYLKAHGPIPDGMVVDHICRVPACVNPEHLRLVTAKQNQENRGNPERGVSWDKQTGSWKAKVTHNRKQINIGRFANKQDAVAAVRAMRNDLFTHNDHDRAA